MMAKLFTILCNISPYLKKLLWRQWYQFLAGYYQKKDWSFMNYGYAPLDHQAEKLNLDNTEEPNRYGIQLYHHVAKAINLKDLKVLEVGSGRGGGSYYIKRYLKPKTMVGVDFSAKAVAFCNKIYSVEGLSFVTGNAEFLPFDDNSFDVIVNVESSHCYGSMDAFLKQVKRVLRQGGYFLYADFRSQQKIDILQKQLNQSGMTFIKETNITPNVVEALNLDNEHRMALIQKLIPKLFLKSFQEFAGIKGSKMYEGFRTERLIYLSFILQKGTFQANKITN